MYNFYQYFNTVQSRQIPRSIYNMQRIFSTPWRSVAMNANNTDSKMMALNPIISLDRKREFRTEKHINLRFHLCAMSSFNSIQHDIVSAFQLIGEGSPRHLTQELVNFHMKTYQSKPMTRDATHLFLPEIRLIDDVAVYISHLPMYSERGRNTR